MDKASNSRIDNWPYNIYEVLKDNKIKQIAFVPDAGHKDLIDYCENETANNNKLILN